METMHFHKTQSGLVYMKTSFRIQGPNEQFGIHEKLSFGCDASQIRHGEILATKNVP